MPRRKPRNLDAVRYELGSYERQLVKDYITVTGLKAASGPLAYGLLGLGIAAGGFLAYNKLEDLADYVSDNWGEGFGLRNDPEQTQQQVSEYIPTSRVRNPDLEGMSAATIYQIHYDMRDDICQYFSRMWCQSEGIEWNGPNHAIFLESVWSQTHLGTGYPLYPTSTYRFERPEVIQVAGSETTNTISEYVYQMIIRETSSRNAMATAATDIVGLASFGIGSVAARGLTGLLRSSGFMTGNNEWDGKNWEEAPGANYDPLLMYAWGRTDFQTGKWWSTVDSQGDIAFWVDVAVGGHGGVTGRTIGADTPSMTKTRTPILDYEGIIWDMHAEMNSPAGFGPVMAWFTQTPGIFYFPTPVYVFPGVGFEKTQDEDREKGEEEQQASAEQERDDYMPGEEDDPENDPTKEEYWRSRGEQPPPGWRPS